MHEEVWKAVKAWADAPAHVRMMAGAYVSPVIDALVAIAADIEKLQKEVRNGQS